MNMPIDERVRKAASARWGGRGKSATIRVDHDVADALKSYGDKARAVASNAIRKAISKVAM